MRLLALDGNSIINRAFYGIKLLTTKDGQYTNALYGFLNIFQKLRDQTGADHIAAAFDLKAPRPSATACTGSTRPGARACRRSWPPSFLCSRSC